jgi:hypothetical protein
MSAGHRLVIKDPMEVKTSWPGVNSGAMGSPSCGAVNRSTRRSPPFIEPTPWGDPTQVQEVVWPLHLRVGIVTGKEP